MLTGEMHGLPLLQFVTVAMLILVNAFFVAAEFAHGERAGYAH